MCIELIVAPQLRSKPTSVLNIRGLFRNSLPTITNCIGIRYSNNVLGKVYYDPKHAGVLGYVAKLVKEG